jgi:hypothetical protein
MAPFSSEELTLATEAGQYLTGQSVARFANAAARTTAIPAPVLNQLTMLNDRPGYVQFWDGGAWTDTTSSTEGMVAGVGIDTIEAITAAAYDALSPPDPTTYYVIVAG